MLVFLVNNPVLLNAKMFNQLRGPLNISSFQWKDYFRKTKLRIFMHFKVYFELIIYALLGCCNIKKKCKSYTPKEKWLKSAVLCVLCSLSCSTNIHIIRGRVEINILLHNAAFKTHHYWQTLLKKSVVKILMSEKVLINRKLSSATHRKVQSWLLSLLLSK